jgi:glutaconate CoA-transferase subunit B
MTAPTNDFTGHRSVGYDPIEFITIALARTLKDGEVGFTGLSTGPRAALYATGIPLAAMGLAQQLHAPNLTILLCGWVINPRLDELRFLPELEFTDVMTDLLSEGRITGYPNAISYKRGIVDFGFSTGAQIDRYGNLNSVQIGTGTTPKVRLVGPILQPEHFTVFGREIIAMSTHSQRSFVADVDYRSGVGHRADGRSRADLGLTTQGPATVLSPYGVFDFDPHGHMRVSQLSPGVTLDEVAAETGFPLEVNPDAEPLVPTAEELQVLRNVVDPHNVLLGGTR